MQQRLIEYTSDYYAEDIGYAADRPRFYGDKPAINKGDFDGAGPRRVIGQYWDKSVGRWVTVYDYDV